METPLSLARVITAICALIKAVLPFGVALLVVNPLSFEPNFMEVTMLAQVGMSESAGRCVVAARDITAGELVVVGESPIVHAISDEVARTGKPFLPLSLKILVTEDPLNEIRFCL